MLGFFQVTGWLRLQEVRRTVNVATEMSLHVLVYNLKRMGVTNLINAMRLAGV